MAEIRFIDRDPQGKICGIYACRQRPEQESLAEDSVELIAHLTAIEQDRVTTQASEMARQEKLRAMADAGLLEKFKALEERVKKLEVKA